MDVDTVARALEAGRPSEDILIRMPAESAALSELAHEDLQAAVACRATRLPRHAGLHIQQCVENEKAAKAILHHVGATPPRTHDLRRLIDLPRDTYPSIGDRFDYRFRQHADDLACFPHF